MAGNLRIFGTLGRGLRPGSGLGPGVRPAQAAEAEGARRKGDFLELGLR